MAHEVVPDLASHHRNVASKFNQFLAAFFATLSAVAAGAAIAWSSPVLPLLQEAGTITGAQAAWVGSLITVGAFLGALPAGWAANRIGRKSLLVLSSVPMLVSWGFVSCSSSAWGLYTGRLLAGLSVGIVSVAAPMYTSEVAEDSIRGTLGTFFQLQLCVGVLFVYVVGLLRNALSISLISASLPLLFVCTFVWMPESPSYLLTKGDKEAAAQALQWLRGFHYDVQPELQLLKNSLRQASAQRATLLDLLRDRVSFRALVLSLGLMVFQQLSAINAIIFYSQPIFQEVGNAVDPTLATVVIGGVQVLATYSSTVLIERAGRRGLLLLSAAVMSVCLGLVGLFFFLRGLSVILPAILPLIFLAIYIFVFSLGFGPIPWVVMGELFPDNLKGISSALAASFSWLLAFAVTFFFNILTNNLGYAFTFWIFAAVCLLGTVFVGVLLPETKGKDIQTIQDELRGERPLITHEYISESPVLVVSLRAEKNKLSNSNHV